MLPSSLAHSQHRIQSRENGIRLDHYLALHYPDHSRSSLGKYIRSSHILVNDKTVKPGYRLQRNDLIAVNFPQLSQENEQQAQHVDFDVLYEDQNLLVINKPPGLVVHPAAGHADQTLVNGLLHRYADIADMAPLESDRPGIVHRLDKDTSGIMLVARTKKVQAMLSAAFKERRVYKTYHALLVRFPTVPKGQSNGQRTGRIVAPVGRHPVHRKKMAIRSDGRYAATVWNILETFPNSLCFAEIGIETGRTHQIRVHMSSLNAPVAGDTLYGGKLEKKLNVNAERQLLHASTLSFTHPITGKECEFTAPLWPDMHKILTRLRDASTA
ncbi:RluA family pseudouridine synthase [Candidatus Electrothrix sp.]|uniref:RluA family pseudouridine synthase n=1 Tax=Candidatus Electrothrix sp. TaxID=2170559 RepID=UPI00405736EC